MNTPVAFHPELGGSPRVSAEHRDYDHTRNLTLVVIAISAFIAGLLLGQTNESTSHESRIHWPTKAEIFR